MDTWELDSPTTEQIEFLRSWIKGMGSVEVLDERYVNIHIHPDGTDELVQFCEDNNIECKLV